jgi:hypothetical protein
MKTIGPTFSAELEAAGLLGLPFAWGGDGALLTDQLTDEQRAAVQAVYDAHDPHGMDKPGAIAVINAAFNAAAGALTAGYPEAERLTWPVQQSEALAWGADNSASTPFLDGLAAARGIDVAEMRQKTLDQVNLFMQASQQLVGMRQKCMDQISAATDGMQLDAVVWG